MDEVRRLLSQIDAQLTDPGELDSPEQLAKVLGLVRQALGALADEVEQAREPAAPVSPTTGAEGAGPDKPA